MFFELVVFCWAIARILGPFVGVLAVAWAAAHVVDFVRRAAARRSAQKRRVEEVVRKYDLF